MIPVTSSAGPKSLRLTSFKLLAYAPQFVAQSLRMFDAEGLDVTFAPHTGAWSDLIGEQATRSSDVTVGNIWFAMQAWREPNGLLPIAHCLQQCGSLLVVRRGPSTSFEWIQLEGKAVAVQSDVPTPWIAFRESLRLRGISLDKVRAFVGLSTADVIDGLTSGAVDYAVLHVERAQRETIEEVAALADVVGPVPWSVYLAGAAAIEANPDPYRRFQRAIGRALQWMASSESRDVADAIAPWFSDVDAQTRTRTIARYRKLDAWPAEPQIRINDLARWQEILVRWGLMAAPMSLPPLLKFVSPVGRSNANPAA